MADRKPFLLRIDRETLDAVQRWADDDLRSLNGQIEFLLRRALRDAGRETTNYDRLRQGSGESAEALRAKAEGRTSKEGKRPNEEG